MCVKMLAHTWYVPGIRTCASCPSNSRNGESILFSILAVEVSTVAIL